MRLSFGLEQKLQQKQILAPRMIQSMEILQLPLLALQERIETELSENPVLEMREADPDLPDEPRPERESSDSPTVEEKEIVVDQDHDNADDFERLVNLDQDVPDHFDERPRVSSNMKDEAGDRKHDMMASLVSRPESLQVHLEHQIGELDVSPELAAMAERIVYVLEPSGYLTTPLFDLLPPDADESLLELAEEALALVQTLEPVGVGARDLKECLLLQITRSMPYSTEMRRLVTDHLEDLRDNRMPAIEKATGYSVQRIHNAWDQLRKLNPLPGRDFAEHHVPNVTPDLFLDRDDNGNYVVRMEETETPSLRISPYYRRRLMAADCTPEEREFIKRKVNGAQWLIDAILQRRSTVTRVAQAIVDYQQRFIEEGPEAIEPLKMQQIADQVGVHVTTVSRAVDDKYIQTPRGIYPLKRFFVGASKGADGEDVAWDVIRIKLQELIDNEDKSKPHSDDELVSRLQEQGLKVARRTITKYRKKMGIPSSRQRKDWTKK
jgi:RNA polymerase sigma-54 factor